MINNLKKTFFIVSSCTYVSFNSTFNFIVWYWIFNDTKKRLSRNKYINYFINYIES